MNIEQQKKGNLETAENFQGDRAKFWAGRMSIGITALLGKQLDSIGDTLELLAFYRDEYNKIIFERTQ